MVHKISLQLATHLLNNTEKREKEISIYVYGIECLIGDILQILALALVGIITGSERETLFYAFTFAVVKSKVGGYHAKTNTACLTILTVSAVVQGVLSRTIPEQPAMVIALICTLIAALLIAIFAPITHPDHPKSVATQIRNRRYCLCMAMLLPFGAILMVSTLPKWVWLPAAFGLFGSSVTLLFAKGGETAWKKENKDYEK